MKKSSRFDHTGFRPEARAVGKQISALWDDKDSRSAHSGTSKLVSAHERSLTSAKKHNRSVNEAILHISRHLEASDKARELHSRIRSGKSGLMGQLSGAHGSAARHSRALEGCARRSREEASEHMRMSRELEEIAGEVASRHEKASKSAGRRSK